VAVSDPATETARLHQIGEVADAIGLSIRTIRHYHDVGLVPPSGRTTGGFRLYTDDDIERLRLIKQMKPLDFTLEEMAELLRTLDQARTTNPTQADPQLSDRLNMYADATDTRCAKLRSQLAAGEDLARTLRDHAHPRPQCRDPQ
jgi:MerR family copper efflux transcriptional regulator